MSHAVDLLSPIFPQEKSAGDAQPVYALAGKLYLSSSGWLMLSVPNALAKGAFDALQEPGVELPPSGPDASFNAHISVARPEELAAIGGGDKISERGHTFRYNIGRIRTTTPAGWPEMSRVWFIEVKSPELEQLRKSYGLSAKPKDNQYEFHISFAVRRRRVLLNGSITKASENYHAKTIEVGQLGAGDQSAGVGQVCEDDGKQAGLAEDIDAAGQLTNTSPTPAQQEAGNYAKGKVQLHGMTVSIENPKGSTRSGTSKDGKSWSVEMKSHYGYIGGTKGKDGDHLDVFLGPQPELELVFVVNQVDPESGEFDEHKVLIGYPTQEAAEAAYLENYADGWQGLGSIKAMTMEQFQSWSKGNLSKEAEQFAARALTAQLSNPTWDASQGVASNLLANVSQFRQRGKAMIQHRRSAESLQAAIDPNYGYQRLADQFAGRYHDPATPTESLLFESAP